MITKYQNIRPGLLSSIIAIPKIMNGYTTYSNPPFENRASIMKK